MLTLLVLLPTLTYAADGAPEAPAGSTAGPPADGQAGPPPPPPKRDGKGKGKDKKGEGKDDDDDKHFKLGGDFQVNFVAERLERIGDVAYESNPPRSTFTVAHLRPRADYKPTDWLAMRAAVEFAAIPDSPPQDPELVGESLAVAATDEDILNPTVDEMFVKLQSTGPLRTSLRMGVMHTSFGLRDEYDRYDTFFMGGQLAYMEPERRFGVSPGIDIGVGWRLAYKDYAALDLQLINGSGVTRLDATAAKDIVARLTLSPVDVVEIRGSWMHAGNAEDGHTHGAFSLGLDGGRFLPGVNPRIVAEGVMSRVTTGGYSVDRLGWLVAAAGDVPLQSKVTDHLSLLVSYSRFDPDHFVAAGQDDPASYDQNWYVDAGANLYWNIDGKGNKREKERRGPQSAAFTGLTWEHIIPQNLDIPVSDSIVVHCGLSR